MKIEIKSLFIPEGWKIHWNHFVDIEPDNDLPIDDVWTHFDEDISYFTFENFFIDLGFYGGEYLTDRAGFFKLYVAEGDFGQGKLFECFVSRSSKEIKEKIELYMKLITDKKTETIEYLNYGEKTDINEYLYSSIENVKERITDSFYEKKRKPIKTVPNKTIA